MGKLIEIFLVIIFIIMVLLVLGKYYYPDSMKSFIDNAGNFIYMNSYYAKYKVEAYINKKDFEKNSVQSAEATSVPVLLYHGISKFEYKSDVLQKNFKDQLFTLKKEGYTTINLEDLDGFINGKKKLPEKSILITFDDGIKSSYYNVNPLLDALDYNAVMFIITKYSLNESRHPYYLSINEIKELMKSNRWEIQPHAKNAHNLILINEEGNLGHFFSNKMWLPDQQRLENDEEFRIRIRNELINVKEDTEKNLGIKVDSFSFPFGDMGENSTNFPEAKNYIVEEVTPIYSTIYHQHWPSKGFTYNHPLNNNQTKFITRLTVSSNWDGKDLIDFLENGKDKKLPFYDDFKFNKGWIKVWGELSISNGIMVLKPLDPSQGTSIFLDGSFLFKDYKFTAKVNSMKKENIILKARYHDDLNYISCDFSDQSIKIEELISGNSATLAKKDNYNLPENSVDLSIKVNGNNIECLVNNSPVISYNGINNIFSNGGIGIRTWSSSNDQSVLIINSINVEPVN